MQSAQVDIDFLPVIGLSATLDSGVQAYGTGSDYWSGNPTVVAPKNQNGAIVGTVTYDVTRNEFDPAFSAQEDYQPGVAGISMQLWKTQKDCQRNLVKTDSGAVAQFGVGDCMRDDTLRGTNAVLAGQACKPFDYYVTESWNRPPAATRSMSTATTLPVSWRFPITLGAEPRVGDYSHTPTIPPTERHGDCIEAPMSGFRIGGNGTVDGNYALTSLMRSDSLASAPAGGSALEDFYADAQNNPDVSDPISTGDYVVEAVNPVDTINSQTTTDPSVGGYIGAGADKRLYKFTDEMAINVMSGDTYVPNQGFGSTGAADEGGYGLTVTPSSPIRYDRNPSVPEPWPSVPAPPTRCPTSTPVRASEDAVNPTSTPPAVTRTWAAPFQCATPRSSPWPVAGRCRLGSSCTQTFRSRRSSTGWSTTTSTST